MWYNQKFFKIIVSTLLIFVILYIGFQLFPLFKYIFEFVTTLFLPVIIAGVFYYMFRPLVTYLDKKKIPRYASIVIIYLLFCVAVSLLIGTVWPYIKTQISEFMAFPEQKLKAMENKTVDIMNVFNFYSLSNEELRQVLLVYLQKITSWISSGLLNNISSFTTVATYFIVIPFILFYFLKDDRKFSQKFLKTIPPSFTDRTKKTLQDIDETLSSYISGQVLVSLIVASLIFIGYLIIGLDYAFLLALVAFTFNLIPFCGPIISTIPALLIGLAQSPMMGVKVILIVAIVHLLDLNLISPRIVGNRLNIHPVTIILLLVASTSLFGLLSLFFIIPLYAVLKILFLDLWETTVIEKGVL